MANNKVLIVDDDEHIVELIKLYMDKEGFDTVTANNGKKVRRTFLPLFAVTVSNPSLSI